MISFAPSAPAETPTLRQRTLRDRFRGVPLAEAVRRAAHVVFRFRYRDAAAHVLWSETEHVWMGNETFLHWSLWEARIDIPWVVALAADVPVDIDELRDAVVAELEAYWTGRTAALPPNREPRWLPLP